MIHWCDICIYGIMLCFTDLVDGVFEVSDKAGTWDYNVFFPWRDLASVLLVGYEYEAITIGGD